MLAKKLFFLPMHWILLFLIVVSKHWSHYIKFQCYSWAINDSIHYVCPFVIRSKVRQKMSGCLSVIHGLPWAYKFGWKLGKKLFWPKILDDFCLCWAEIQWVQVFWGFCFGFLPDREMGQCENNYGTGAASLGQTWVPFRPNAGTNSTSRCRPNPCQPQPCLSKMDSKSKVWCVMLFLSFIMLFLIWFIKMS